MSSPFTFTIPRAVVFSKEQMEKIEECLDELAKDTGAWSILLTDTTGQLIEIQGRIDEKRADIIPAGLLILRKAFEVFDINEMTVSENALLPAQSLSKSWARAKTCVLTLFLTKLLITVSFQP